MNDQQRVIQMIYKMIAVYDDFGADDEVPTEPDFQITGDLEEIMKELAKYKGFSSKIKKNLEDDLRFAVKHDTHGAVTTQLIGPNDMIHVAVGQEDVSDTYLFDAALELWHEERTHDDWDESIEKAIDKVLKDEQS